MNYLANKLYKFFCQKKFPLIDNYCINILKTTPQPGGSRRLFPVASIEGAKIITLQYNVKRIILQHSTQYHPFTPFSAWCKVKTERHFTTTCPWPKCPESYCKKTPREFHLLVLNNPHAGFLWSPALLNRLKSSLEIIHSWITQL